MQWHIGGLSARIVNISGSKAGLLYRYSIAFRRP